VKYHRWLLAVASGVTLVLLPTTTQPASTQSSTGQSSSAQSAVLADDEPGHPGGWRPGPDGGDKPQPPPTRSLCVPGRPPNAPQTIQFFDHNPLLGPAQLPLAPPVGPLLAGYRRFGALTQAAFLQQYGNPTQTGYVFPPASGFAIGPDGRPIKTEQTLLPGYRLDRFGFPIGQFLTPLGTPFSSRSMTPQSLNTPADSPLANYHVYCVVKPFAVDSGPVAPWFAQPGMGTLFMLNRAYLPQAGTNLSVRWLLDNGYLVEENLNEASPPCVADSVPRQGGLAASRPCASSADNA
jgi:hypothetical protein